MTSNTLAGTASISAMELRKNPGLVLDRVFYRNESLVIERSGNPKAVLVPVLEYEQMQRIKKDSKTRLFQTIDKMRKNASAVSPKTVEVIIDEAIKSTKENASTS